MADSPAVASNPKLASAPAVAVLMAARIDTPEQRTWLAEAIDSLRAQTLADWQLIVVDDASPLPITPSEGEPRIVHLRLEKPSGPAAARNLAAAYTRAPWLFCLDADDKLKPNALERLFAARDESKFVYGDLEWIGLRTGFFAINEWSMESLRAVKGPIGVTALQPRKLWKALGGWREDLEGYEDIEYWIRAAECGVAGKHIAGAIFEYRTHAGSRMARFAREGRTGQLQDIVRQAHLPFLEARATAAPSRKDTRMGGKVRVLYTGPREASFPLQSSPSGQAYRCDGRNSLLTIEQADLEWILSFREAGQQVYKLYIPAAPALPSAPVVQAPVNFESIIVESIVPPIKDLNAKDAAKAVMGIDNVVDLNVALAVENATAKRTTVLDAIERRRKELSA